MGTSKESVPGTQPLSSASRLGSWLPAWVQSPFALMARQFSKCPISSDMATLYVCADQVLPRGLAVEYSGWNAYGFTLQVLDVGWYRTWPNPLAFDAVIEPPR